MNIMAAAKGSSSDRWLAISVLLACAAFMFAHAGAVPITLWDEGRIVVSALEMRHTGLSTVATYDFLPDTWNTKPPLLIWLMTASMTVLGPTEAGVRLPSAIAAMGTLLLVMRFLWRLSGSMWTAALGAVLLATSVGFFGEHGALTGDYDALLCFFTTGYLYLLFFAVHRRTPGAGRLLLAGALAAGALMTKAIAGAIPGAGFVLYLLVTGRWRRPLQTPWYVAAAVLALLPLAVFLLAREAAAPGYIAAAFYNDLSGRFAAGGDGHPGSPFYLIDATFVAGLFACGGATLLAPLAAVIARGRVRQGLVFATCIAIGQLLVLMSSPVRLAHYYLPAYPFLAIMVALAAHVVLTAQAGVPHARARRGAVRIVVILLLAHGIVVGIVAQRTVFPAREDYPEARYGALLARLPDRSDVLLFERGIPIAGNPHYTPQLRFYALAAAERGMRVRQVWRLEEIAAAPPGTVFGSCDGGFVQRLRRRGADLASVPGCALVR